MELGSKYTKVIHIIISCTYYCHLITDVETYPAIYQLYKSVIDATESKISQICFTVTSNTSLSQFTNSYKLNKQVEFGLVQPNSTYIWFRMKNALYLSTCMHPHFHTCNTAPIFQTLVDWNINYMEVFLYC